MSTIASLNDELRRSLANIDFLSAPRHDAYIGLGSNVLHITNGVCDLGQTRIEELLRLVADFDTFTEDNDPYGEHDFGKFEYRGKNYYFKIDYYDGELKFHSPDAADPRVTRRVLTVMHTSEY